MWCNFVFNLNKKIYRVPEILFYYRLKNHEESRNYQKREKHEYLLKALENKYPKLAKEKQKRGAKTFSDKVVHFIRNIRRFFIRRKKEISMFVGFVLKLERVNDKKIKLIKLFEIYSF